MDSRGRSTREAAGSWALHATVNLIVHKSA